MNPRVPKNVVAVTPGGNITLDMLLGFYALTSVPDRFVSASKLSRIWASKSLPMNLVPTTRKAVDTFKNACRSVETRRRAADAANRSVEVKVDQVEETQTECVYQITRMVRDRTQRVIDHPKAMRVTFSKTQEDIAFDALTSKWHDELDALQKAILESYDANSEKVPGSKVRAAVRGLMAHLNAVNVRGKSGGIYFVPKDGKDDLDGLGEVMEYLYGDDAMLHLIPCASDEGQREIVERHFEMTVSQEIDETIAKVADKLGSTRKVRSDALGNLLVKRRELGELRNKYAELLSSEVSLTGEKLNLLDEQLGALVEQASVAS